jgi:hypothetical protein
LHVEDQKAPLKMGNSHRIVVQPIDLAGAPAGPLVVVAETGSRSAVNLTLHSLRIDDRLDLLLAWQGAQQGGGTADVHAAYLTCAY